MALWAAEIQRHVVANFLVAAFGRKSIRADA
jgi:hypothetical protein